MGFLGRSLWGAFLDMFRRPRIARIEGDLLQQDPCKEAMEHGADSTAVARAASGLRAHSGEMLPALVAARLRFTIDDLQVCRLTGQAIDRDGNFSAEEYEFLPITGEDHWYNLPRHQETAEIVVMDLPVHQKVSPGSGGQLRLPLRIRAFDRTEEFTVELEATRHDREGRPLYELVV